MSLARALVVEPEVLLLDEPLSQLDAALRVEMRELVRRVQQEVGVTTLFVTHDQEEAVSVADRVALLLAGRLQQVGPARSFYEAPGVGGRRPVLRGGQRPGRPGGARPVPGPARAAGRPGTRGRAGRAGRPAGGGPARAGGRSVVTAHGVHRHGPAGLGALGSAGAEVMAALPPASALRPGDQVTVTVADGDYAVVDPG